MTTDADIRAQAADLIDGALDVLAERGLSDGGWQDGQGRPCVHHAIGTAGTGICGMLGIEGFSLVSDVASGAIRAEMGWHSIGRWSDSSPYEDVALCLKRAAHSLRTEVA